MYRSDPIKFLQRRCTLAKGVHGGFPPKENEEKRGELPKYYVEEDHGPIISPWLFDYVQERTHVLRLGIQGTEESRCSAAN